MHPGDEATLEAFAGAALDLVRGEPVERALGAVARTVARAVGAPVVLAVSDAGSGVDPEHLATPYWTSQQFKRENGTAGWNPTPCASR